MAGPLRMGEILRKYSACQLFSFFVPYFFLRPPLGFWPYSKVDFHKRNCTRAFKMLCTVYVRGDYGGPKCSTTYETVYSTVYDTVYEKRCATIGDRYSQSMYFCTTTMDIYAFMCIYLFI